MSVSTSTIHTIACRIYSVLFVLLSVFCVGCGIVALYWSATGLPPQLTSQVPKDVGGLPIETFAAALGGGFFLVGVLHGWLAVYAWTKRNWPLIVGTPLWVLLTLPSLVDGAILPKLVLPGLLILLTIAALLTRSAGDTLAILATRPIFNLQRRTIPRNARHFEKLMGGVMLLQIIAAPLQYRYAAKTLQDGQLWSGSGQVFAIVVPIATIALIGLLIWFVVYRRRNWARWVFMVWYLVSLPFGIAAFKRLFELDYVLLAVGALNLVAWGAALYFIFTGDAKAWFARVQPGAMGRVSGTPAASRRKMRLDPLMLVILGTAILVSASLLVFLFTRH